jgi:hypothetical protein
MSSMKPKDDGWGIEEAVADAAEKVRAGEKSPMIPVIGAVDIKELKIDPATGEHTAIVQIRRINAITSVERARQAQTMILQEVAAMRGEGAMLPFEEKEIIERAFGGMTGKTVGDQLQDDEEASIDEKLTDVQRIARHLVAVHDFDPKILNDDETTDADIHRAHDTEHAKDPSDRAWPDHDPEDVVWRRADLAAMIGDAEEPTETDQGTTLYEVDGAITDDPNPHPLPGEANPLIPEFESPGEAVDAESLNPQLGEPDEDSGNK